MLDFFLWTLVGSGCLVIASLAGGLSAVIVMAMVKTQLTPAAIKLTAVK